MKRNITVYILESVGCMIDPLTLDTYPTDRTICVPENCEVILKNIEVYDGESVHFDDVTDEWLENLSPQDILTILKIVRDSQLK